MLKKIKTIAGAFLFLFCSLLASFSFGVAFKNTDEVTAEITSRIISNNSALNSLSKIYMSSTIQKDNNSMIDELYLSEYYKNFSYNFTQLPIYTNKSNGKFSTFNLTCLNSEIHDFKWCDTIAYTNQASLKRFETININLFKEPNKMEELAVYPEVTGYIYIPDFFADDIIKQSNGLLKSYYDLLPNLIDKTVEERMDFLNKYSVSIFDDDTLVGKYRIANIFHVAGFKESYSYNDNDSGKLFFDFIGNYFISYYKPSLATNIKGLVSIFDSKKYILREKLDNYKSRAINSSVKIGIFKVNDNVCDDISCSSLANDYIHSSGSFNYYYLIFPLIYFVSFVGVLIFNNNYKIIIRKSSYVILAVFLFLGAILQILASSFLSNCVAYLSIYNVFFCCFYISSIIILFLYVLFYRKFKK